MAGSGSRSARSDAGYSTLRRSRSGHSPSIEPDELHVVEVTVAGRLRVDNLQARVARLHRERLAAEPSADRRPSA